MKIVLPLIIITLFLTITLSIIGFAKSTNNAFLYDQYAQQAAMTREQIEQQVAAAIDNINALQGEQSRKRTMHTTTTNIDLVGVSGSGVVIAPSPTTHSIDISLDDNIVQFSSDDNGLCNLDSFIVSVQQNGTIVCSDLPDNIARLDMNNMLLPENLPIETLSYKGEYNAATNTPTLIEADCNADTRGDFYSVSVGGLAFTYTFRQGDWLICNYNGWALNRHSSQVLSVNGQDGIVELDHADMNNVEPDQHVDHSTLFVNTDEYLTGGGGDLTTSTTIDVDTTLIQRRVQDCPSGEAVQSVEENGNTNCLLIQPQPTYTSIPLGTAVITGASLGPLGSFRVVTPWVTTLQPGKYLIGVQPCTRTSPGAYSYRIWDVTNAQLVPGSAAANRLNSVTQQEVISIVSYVEPTVATTYRVEFLCESGLSVCEIRAGVDAANNFGAGTGNDCDSHFWALKIA